jgi:glyoxylase I family protein
MMRIEHLGYMVADPVKAARWYVDHMGFHVRRRLSQSPWTHFLADASGHVMLEIYNNPRVTVPDYAAMDSLVLHLAFSVDDVRPARDKLLAVGASAEGEITVTDSGDQLAMLRDPWGMAIQLVRRADPMVH